MKPCGTDAAYTRHRRNGEPPCPECRQARNTYERERHRKRTGAKPWKPARCGTRSGYDRHRRLGEAPCPACKEAENERARLYYYGEWQSRRKARVSSYDIIEDVLETFYPMTAEVLVSHVLDVKPGWKAESVRRAVERMVADGRLERFERLGEWLVRLA